MPPTGTTSTSAAPRNLFLTLSGRPFSTHYLKVGTRESPTDDDTGPHRPPSANPARLTHPPHQGHRGAAATTATGSGAAFQRLKVATLNSGAHQSPFTHCLNRTLPKGALHVMILVRIRWGINRVHPHRVSAQAVSRARARRRSGCLPISTGKNSRRYRQD